MMKQIMHLVDVISDKAGSKGTGKWTSQDAMELPVSIPTIDTAVAMRTLSGYKDERAAASELYQAKTKDLKGKEDKDIKKIKDALYFSMIICLCARFGNACIKLQQN